MTSHPKKEPSTEDRLAGLNRQLPFSDEAEKGVLSCILAWPEWLSTIRGTLLAEAFYHVTSREVYVLLLEMLDANLPIDAIALTHFLRERDKLDFIGGAAAITELVGSAPIQAHRSFYLKTVQDKFHIRRAIHACAESLDELLEHGSREVVEDPAEVIGRAESRVFECVQGLEASGEYSTGAILAKIGVAKWVEHMTQVIDNRGQIMGLATNILELDETVHGLQDGDGEIVVIAARPGQGKTAMATSIAYQLSVAQNVPGLIFSAEMNSDQLYTRIILGAGGVDTAKAITAHFSREDQAAMNAETHKVQRSPLLISDGSHITTADIRAQVQVAKRQHGIRYIVVDHLHLIKAVSARGRKDEREALVEVMETLQFVKKYYHVAVFLLVQLSRETDRAVGKPPVLADLSGSAAIEWYADHVWMLHRPSYFVHWNKLSDDQRLAWQDLVKPRRERCEKLNMKLWSSGTKYSDDEGGYAREDYEEDALVYVRKNRRGPTPELHIRYEGFRTWFSTRMPKLNSTNPLDWQIGTYQVNRKSSTRPKSASGARVKKADSLDEIFPDE